MYLCRDNFSCFSGKYFKGVVYEDLPSDKSFHNRFFKMEKRHVEINDQKVETASKKRKRK